MLPSQCLRRYGHRRCRERLKKEKRTRGMMRLQEDSLYHLRPRDSPILLSIPSSLSKNRQNIKAFPTSSSSSLQSSLSSPVSYSPSSSSSSSSSSCPSFFFSRRCSFLLSSLSLSHKGPAPAALRHSGVAAFFHTQRGETRRRRSISSSPLSSLGTNTSTHVCTAKPLQTTSSASFTENQIKERKEEEEGYLLSSNRRHPSYLLTPSLSSEEYSSYSFSPSSSCCLLPFSPHSFSSFSPRFPSFSRSFSSSYIMSRHAPLKASFAASISSSSSSSVSSSSYSLRLLSSRLSSHRCSLGPRKVISSSLISRTQAMDLFHPFVFHSSSSSSNPLLLVQHSGSPSSFLSSSLERSFSRSFSSRPFSSSSSPREKRGEEANEEIETFQSISEAPPRGRGGRRKRQTAMSHRSCREDDSEGYLNNVEERAEGYPGVHTLAVTREQFHDGSRGLFRPHPFNRRFARVRKPVFPIEARNLRLMYKRKAKRRRGRGDKSNAKGIRWKHVHQQAGRYKGPRSRTFEGGKTPLYKRIPKWPEAWLQR
ncbi:ribosomal protein l15, partial [Cystoisospora suis]